MAIVFLSRLNCRARRNLIKRLGFRRWILELFAQLGFLKSQLAELLDMELMLSTTPVMREGNTGLKLRNLVV